MAYGITSVNPLIHLFKLFIFFSQIYSSDNKILVNLSIMNLAHVVPQVMSCRFMLAYFKLLANCLK